MRLIVLAALAVALAIPASARADVVPPAPASCPPGQVGISSHSGPGCVLDAPKDCPTGWTGLIRGQCTLQPCSTDEQCGGGDTCTIHTVCLEPYQDDSYDQGEKESEGKSGQRGAGPYVGSPRVLAGPMPQREKRPKPIFRYSAVNVCAASAACALPRTCQKEGLCVPRGARAQPHAGSNVAHARVARKTETMLTTGETPPPDEIVRPGTSDGGPQDTVLPVTPPAERRGCGGCAATGTPTSWWTLAIGVALTIAIALRLRGRLK